MNRLNYTYLLLALFAALLLQACDGNRLAESPAGGTNCFNLTVSVPQVATKAVVGSDELHEFTVNSLHLYFFRNEGHSDATSEPVMDVAVDGTFEVSRQLRLELPDDALQAGGLFGPTDNTCQVYAVANVDEAQLTARTIDGLKAVVVGSGFDKTEPQPAFAMDGLATLNLDRANRTVTGTITLQRAAAKLTLAVDLPATIDVEEEIYNPNDGTTQKVNRQYTSRPDEMHVWMSNGVKTSPLHTDPQPADEEALYSNAIHVADGVGSAFTYDAAQPKYHYLQNVPFYSYPAKWDSYSPKGNCFLTLEIPWTYKDEGGVTQNVVTYYRLSVQPGKDAIERNTYYDMRVTISRLGGLVVQEPIDMLFDWNYNMLWNTQTLLTDIKEVRYLLFNNNDFSSALDAYTYTMENEQEISIPYNTSHPVKIESVELTWRDYLNNADRTITLTTDGNYTYTDGAHYTPATHFAGIDINAMNSTLNLRRDTLHIAWESNSAVIKSTESAINAYTFRIKLRHTDAADNADPSSHTTVVITQIPAICITSQMTTSANHRFVNNNYSYSNNNGGSTTIGYLNSTGWHSPNIGQQNFYLGSIHNDDNVQNKNTYILTISKFTGDDDYIIADPRKREVDNLNESGTAATATATWSRPDANNVRLGNYYPVDDNTTKARFIAPQIRIASQWGVTYNVYRRGAERRCASYQENGRPAGRWRLPTPAEIEYICRLSSKHYIPYLFGTENNTASYWCSVGGVDVNNSTTNPSVSINPNATGARAVRCVYDEWFWKNDTLTQANKTRFYWGDRLRTTTGN